MARKVYTYQSITELSRQPYYEEIIEYPYITATIYLRQAMQAAYGEIRNLLDIYSIQTKVAGKWFDSATVTGQYINLSAVLKEMTNVPESEKNLHNAFLKNKKEILNAIRFLVEAEVYPDDITVKSAEEKMFQGVWRKMEEIDLSFAVFRAEMDAVYSDYDSFCKCFTEIPAIRDSETIVLHGFYYITAIQERIFDILERHGKQLIFLCCIDQSLPEMEEIWYSTLSQSNGFAPASEWVGKQSSGGLGYNFGALFSNVHKPEKLQNVKIIRYENEASFMSDLKRIEQDGYTIYTSDSYSAERMLKEVFPEKFKKRHLLSYPAGQYLYALHSMWDAKTQSLKLSIDDIQKCFASGWVISGELNGRDYTYALEQLRVFFSDCDTTEKWKLRTEYLRTTGLKLKQTFESHIDDLPDEERRWHEIMSNPFLNFSCYSLDSENLNHVCQLIEALIDTAEFLFDNKAEVDITVHFEKLESLILAGNLSDMYEEEQVIMNELLERMKHPFFPAKKCMPEDISEAVMMIIGGGILDEDSYEFIAVSEEPYFFSLFHVETAAIKSDGKIHLCLADENCLPGGAKKYKWPLSLMMLNETAANISGRRKQYLEDMIHVNESYSLANRYLFYSAIQNKDVELSWIAERDRKEIAESPYIKILTSVFSCDTVNLGNDCVAADDREKYIPASLRISDHAAPIDEVRMAAALCPWKYIYGYLIEHHPSYRSEFHYKFALSALIGALEKVLDCAKDVVADNVLASFPYLTTVEKQQIRDFASKKFFYEGTDSLGSASYVRERLKPHFLQEDLIVKANKRMEENHGHFLNPEFLNVETADYRTCLFCPHRDECIHTVREKEDNE